MHLPEFPHVVECEDEAQEYRQDGQSIGTTNSSIHRDWCYHHVIWFNPGGDLGKGEVSLSGAVCLCTSRDGKIFSTLLPQVSK